MLRSLSLATLILLASPASAQEGPELATALGERLAATYVDPDVGLQMQAALERYALSDEARELEGEALAAAVQRVARSVYDDEHINVHYNLDGRGAPDTAAFEEMFRAAMLRTNHGFRDVRVLGGNVGYIHIETFAPRDAGLRAVEAAFSMVAETDALVIDVRRSQGGDPRMVAEVVSRLIDGEPRLLNSFVNRHDPVEEFWSRRVEGPGNYGTQRPVYVVIGPETPSASEDIAYQLQALGRATIVGETTAGAANPGDEHQLTENFSVFVPDGRAVNAVTGGNWEGVGVIPDIDAPSDEAAVAAYRLALDSLAQTADEPTAARLRRSLAGPMPTLAPAR